MSWENYQLWLADRDAQIAFFVRRKQWARNLMSSLGLTKPGDSTEDIFEGCKFMIVIGPRGGVKISPICKKAHRACAQIRSGNFQLPIPLPPDTNP